MSRPSSKCSTGRMAPRSGESWWQPQILTLTCPTETRPGARRFRSGTTGRSSLPAFEPEELGQRKDDLADACVVCGREGIVEITLDNRKDTAPCGNCGGSGEATVHDGGSADHA